MMSPTQLRFCLLPLLLCFLHIIQGRMICRSDVVELIEQHSTLFSDVPTLDNCSAP